MAQYQIGWKGHINICMIKVGLIGKGYFGSFIYSKFEDKLISEIAECTWVCNSKDDYKSKLDEVDWVFVTVPNQFHYEIVKDCLHRGKNVYCEKPLTLKYEQSEILYDMAEMNNVKLYVGDVFKYREEYKDLLKFYNDNPKHIISSWKKTSRSEYGKFQPATFPNLIYHDLYLMYPYLNNKTIKEIKIFEKEKFLKFEVMFDDVKVFFDYDRAWDDNIDKSILIHKWNGQSIPPPDDARQHFIGDIRLDIQRNDSLLKMIYEILSDNVDIKINNETALWVEKIMKDIQEIIFP